MIGVDCRVRMTTLLWGSQSKIHSTQHCVPYSRIHLSNVKGLKCQSEAQQDNGEGLGMPTRLLCTWDSPGKNTGVGCHALLQRIF